MKTAEEWIAQRCHSLKGVTQGTVREIQEDAKGVQTFVRVGDVAISRLENGQLWLTYRGGEGMAVGKEEKLAKVLEEFFRREF